MTFYKVLYLIRLFINFLVCHNNAMLLHYIYFFKWDYVIISLHYFNQCNIMNAIKFDSFLDIVIFARNVYHQSVNAFM